MLLLLGMLIIALLPFIKAPVLAVLAWMPYANLFVTGLYMSIFVLIGGMIGNGYSRKDVCYRQMAVPTWNKYVIFTLIPSCLHVRTFLLFVVIVVLSIEWDRWRYTYKLCKQYKCTSLYKL